MKKITFGFLIISLIVVGGIFALAKKSGGGGDRSPGRDGFREKIFDRIARDLNLSEAQRTQAKQVLEDSKSRLEPLAQQLGENRKKVRETGTDGVYNEQKVQELADAQTDLMKQLFIEKEKTKARLFAILTSEQREKAVRKMSDFEERMRKNGPRGHGAFHGDF